MGSCLTTNHCWMPSKFQPPNFPTVILLFVWLPKYQHYCIKQHNLTNDMNKAAAFPRSPRFFSSAAGRKTYRRSPESSNCHGGVNRLCPGKLQQHAPSIQIIQMENSSKWTFPNQRDGLSTSVSQQIVITLSTRWTMSSLG